MEERRRELLRRGHRGREISLNNPFFLSALRVSSVSSVEPFFSLKTNRLAASDPCRSCEATNC